MKSLMRSIVLAIPAVILLNLPSADAVPAFSRQMGVACSSCHFQHYPALNAFGRAFKRSGFTMKGSQEVVEGQRLSLPVTLNAALITKIRYQKTNGETSETDVGEFQFPDEAALLIGGRAGNHVGFVLEFATFGQTDDESHEFSLFGSYKTHLNYAINEFNLGAVIFTTDGGGAPYGFELLNTGAQRFMRIAEDRTATSAQQFIGFGSGEAQGVAFVASHPLGFVNATLWTPDHGNVAVSGFAQYFRAAATPTLGPWELGLGVQWFTGVARRSEESGGDISAGGWALDAQAQGMIGFAPIGLYLTYGHCGPDATSVFGAHSDEKQAWSILSEVGVVPGKATLMAGVLDGRNGTAASAGRNEERRILFGGTYMLSENLQFQVSNTFRRGNAFDPKPSGGGDNLLMFMLMAGF